MAASPRSEKNSVQLARGLGNNLGLVLDIGLGTVAAGGGFGVPSAVGGFVFDRLGSAGHALLGGGAPGGGQRRGVVRKRLGKHPVDGIGPAAVMLNDLVGDVGHELLAGLPTGVNTAPILCQNAA